MNYLKTLNLDQYLEIDLKKVELYDQGPIEVICQAYLISLFNQKAEYIDQVELNDTSKNIQIDWNKLQHQQNGYIQLILKNKLNDQSLGSISLHMSNFNQIGLQQLQWITLFDDQYDDVYDGQFGEDDIDVPRAQFSFIYVDNFSKHDYYFQHQASVNSVNSNEQKLIEYLNHNSGLDKNGQLNCPLRISQFQNISNDQISQHLRKNTKDNQDFHDEQLGEEFGQLQQICIALRRQLSELRTNNENQNLFIEQLQKQVKDKENFQKIYDNLQKGYQNQIQEKNLLVQNLNEKLSKTIETLKNQYNEKVRCLEQNIVQVQKQFDHQQCDILLTKNENFNLKSIIDNNLQKINALEQQNKQQTQKTQSLQNNYDQLLDIQHKNNESFNNQRQQIERNLVQQNETIKSQSENIQDLKQTNFMLSSENKQNKMMIDMLNQDKIKLENDMKTQFTRFSSQIDILNVRQGELLQNYEQDKKQFKSFSMELENKVSQLNIDIEILRGEKTSLQNEFNLLKTQKQNLQEQIEQEKIQLFKEQLQESENLKQSLQTSLIDQQQQFKKSVEEIQKSQKNNEDQYQKQINKLVKDIDDQNRVISELNEQTQQTELFRKSLYDKDIIIKNLNELKNELVQQNSDLQKTVKTMIQEVQIFRKDNISLQTENLEFTEDNSKKDMRIKGLINDLEEIIKNFVPKCNENYKAQENDIVDVKLAQFLSGKNVPVKFVRIGEGVYTFGSKKIYVKIENNHLCIRVGGGYLMIDEFLKKYMFQELSNLQISQKYQQIDISPVKKQSTLVQLDEDEDVIKSPSKQKQQSPYHKTHTSQYQQKNFDKKPLHKTKTTNFN